MTGGPSPGPLPVVIPPDSRQPRRSPDRPDPSRPSGVSSDGADDARLAPAEQTRIDEAVVRVGRGRGSGPILVAVLVVAAFLLGLVRPWDWLDGDRTGVDGARPGVDGGPLDTSGTGDPAGLGGPAAPAPFQAPTCGYPTGWRTAAISFWAGARARIWTAAEAVVASGPSDPAIPFDPIASDRVEAIGWCAPVSGPERPPLSAEGTLFRVHDGVATEVPVDRLEPAARDALGELWAPLAESVDGPPLWTPGRYVVRLATPSGTYARYLGLQVGTPDATPAPSPSANEKPDRPAAGSLGVDGSSPGAYVSGDAPPGRSRRPPGP